MFLAQCRIIILPLVGSHSISTEMVKRAISLTLCPARMLRIAVKRLFFWAGKGFKIFWPLPPLALLHCLVSTSLCWRASSIRAGDVHFVDSLTRWSRITKSEHLMMQEVMTSSDGGDHAADSGTLWKMKESTAADHRPIAPFIAI